MNSHAVWLLFSTSGEESSGEVRRSCRTSSSSVLGDMCVMGRGAMESAGRRERRAGIIRASLGVEVGSQKAALSVPMLGTMEL